MQGTERAAASGRGSSITGGFALPDLTHLDPAHLSRSHTHPVLRTIAHDLVHRAARGTRATALYEDSPYQL